MTLSKELILLSIVSIVFLAGCTSSSSSPASAGVVINSFAPDLQEVDGSSQVTFSIAVKNVGGRTASNIKALLFGLSNEWIPQITNTKPISTTLAPADPATGLTGEEGSADWTLTAPAGKGSDTTYDASVRVFYTYTTEDDTLLRFVTSNYLRTAPNTQKGIVSSVPTAGPLVITAVARTPTLSIGATTGRVQFEIQNVGGGRVFDTVSDTGEITTLDLINKITISGLGDTGTCAGVGSGGTAVFDGTTNAKIRLAAGKSKVISCDIDVRGIINFADRSIKLVAEYNYFVDSATQVKVLRSLTETPVTPPPIGATPPTITLSLTPNKEWYSDDVDVKADVSSPDFTITKCLFLVSSGSTLVVNEEITNCKNLKGSTTFTKSVLIGKTDSCKSEGEKGCNVAVRVYYEDPSKTPTTQMPQVSKDLNTDFTAPALSGFDPTTATKDTSTTFTVVVTDVGSHSASCSSKADGTNQGSMTGASCTTTSCSATRPFTFTSIGAHTIEIQCTDKAGNVGELKTFDVTVS